MTTLDINPKLTRAPIDGVASNTHKGQASWANNWKHTCATCDFKRDVFRKPKFISCAKFQQLTQANKPVPFDRGATACRFWEPVQDTKSQTATVQVRK
jgi:hypothetical protein